METDVKTLLFKRLCPDEELTKIREDNHKKVVNRVTEELTKIREDQEMKFLNQRYHVDHENKLFCTYCCRVTETLCDCRDVFPHIDCLDAMDTQCLSIEAPTHPFAFTLRRTNKKGGVSIDDYKKQLDKLCTKNGITLVDSKYEMEAGLHCHGIFEIPTKFNFKKLRVRGWNMLCKEITDLAGWLRYINKSQ